MKTIIIRIIALLSVFFVSCSDMNRSPRTLFRTHYGIDLSKFDYTVETFEDQWMGPDGHTFILLRFADFTCENKEYLMSKGLKSIESNRAIIDKIPRHDKEKYKDCFYIFQSEGIDSEHSYKLLVVDFESKEMLLYYILE